MGLPPPPPLPILATDGSDLQQRWMLASAPRSRGEALDEGTPSPCLGVGLGCKAGPPPKQLGGG